MRIIRLFEMEDVPNDEQKKKKKKKNKKKKAGQTQNNANSLANEELNESIEVETVVENPETTIDSIQQVLEQIPVMDL